MSNIIFTDRGLTTPLSPSPLCPPFCLTPKKDQGQWEQGQRDQKGQRVHRWQRRSKSGTGDKMSKMGEVSKEGEGRKGVKVQSKQRGQRDKGVKGQTKQGAEARAKEVKGAEGVK